MFKTGNSDVIRVCVEMSLSWCEEKVMFALQIVYGSYKIQDDLNQITVLSLALHMNTSHLESTLVI